MKEQLTKNRPYYRSQVTCTSGVNMQCPAEKRGEIGLGRNEPTISTSIPDKEDWVDLTGVDEDVHVDKCSCGGDLQRLLWFALCMSFICICIFAFPNETSYTMCGLALMAVSMTSVNYIYIWFFYPTLCLNFTFSLVRGCLSPLLFYVLIYTVDIITYRYFQYSPDEFYASLLSCCLCACILNIGFC